MEKLIKNLKFKRRRKALTNYAKRVNLVKSGLDRIVVRKTERRIIGQIVRYHESGDVVLKSADSRELAKYGWPARSNKPTAYLTGLLMAQKMKEKGKNYILDIGLATPAAESIPFVFAKGCIDGGLNVKASLSIDEKRYNGLEIEEYAKRLKANKEAYERQFGSYAKDKIDVENLTKLFNEVKEKIKNGAIGK